VKITKITPFLVDRCLLVRVYTDAGIVGTGEAGLWAHHRLVFEAINDLSDYFVGQDASRIEHHWQTVTRDTHFFGPILSAALSSIDIALQRFAEYHALEGAFGRRAITERAKGILMERNSIDEEQAFNLIRDHSRRTHRKVVEVAEAILASHRLLPRRGMDDIADAPLPEPADRGPHVGGEG